MDDDDDDDDDDDSDDDNSDGLVQACDGLVQPFGGSSIPQLWIENMQTWSNGCAKTLRLV